MSGPGTVLDPVAAAAAAGTALEHAAPPAADAPVAAAETPALAGDLASFGPPDVLQWLRWAQADGAVEFHGPAERIVLHLERGRIVHASADGPSVRAGEVLVHRGLADPEAVARALGAQRERGGRLGDHLEPAVEPAALRDAIEECARRIVLRLLTWNEGSFRFLRGCRWDTLGLGADLDPEGLVLDALRIADSGPPG